MTIDEGQFARTLVAGMPDAILYADEAGLIRFWIAAIMRDTTARFEEVRTLRKQRAEARASSGT